MSTLRNPSQNTVLTPLQEVSTASVSAAYINCTVGSPGPGYLNITQELANTETHEYENIGPDTPGTAEISRYDIHYLDF